MNNRAILYARVSTEEQTKGHSLPKQLEACRKYAKGKGYQIVREFTDVCAGTELERPGMNELFQSIQTTKIRSLIVYDVDRLSRSVSDLTDIVMEMAEAGITIEYVVGEHTEPPEVELTKVILSGVAQYENRHRTECGRRRIG